jgi:hypothetical protein
MSHPKRQLGTFKEREPKFEVGKTYDVVTPESAEEGDFAESGWVYEPTVMTLREAFDEIANLGGFEPSEWPMPVTGTHLTLYQIDGNTDYRTGAETREALHIAGRPGPMKRLRQLLKARMHKRRR